MMDHSPHAGMTGINLPVFPFHGPKQEQLRLIQAVRNNLGPCNCQVHQDFWGNSCEGHPCAGHLFLCEVDEPGRTLEWTVPQVPEITFERDGQRINLLERRFTHFTSGVLQNCVTRLDRLVYVRASLEVWMKGEGWEKCLVCDRATFPDDPQHRGHDFIRLIPPLKDEPDRDVLPW